MGKEKLKMKMLRSNSKFFPTISLRFQFHNPCSTKTKKKTKRQIENKPYYSIFHNAGSHKTTSHPASRIPASSAVSELHWRPPEQEAWPPLGSAAATAGEPPDSAAGQLQRRRAGRTGNPPPRKRPAKAACGACWCRSAATSRNRNFEMD